MKSALASLSALAAVFVPTALAEDTFSFDFTIDRASLNTTDGAQDTLDAIERQAKRHCGYRTGIQSLEEKKFARKCVENTLDGAVAQISSPKLTELMELRNQVG